MQDCFTLRCNFIVSFSCEAYQSLRPLVSFNLAQLEMIAATIRVFELNFVSIHQLFILARIRIPIINTFICILFFPVYLGVDLFHHGLYLFQIVLPGLIPRARQHPIFLVTATFNRASRAVILRVNV